MKRYVKKTTVKKARTPSSPSASTSAPSLAITDKRIERLKKIAAIGASKLNPMKPVTTLKVLSQPRVVQVADGSINLYDAVMIASGAKELQTRTVRRYPASMELGRNAFQEVCTL